MLHTHLIQQENRIATEDNNRKVVVILIGNRTLYNPECEPGVSPS
jgi:hypothetical protein